MYVWKKGRLQSGRRVLIRLTLTGMTRIFFGTGNKHRCDSAVVSGIYSLGGKKLKETTAFGLWAGRYQSTYSQDGQPFAYVVGNLVKPRTRFRMAPVVCAPGIHFFLTPRQARKFYI